MGVFHAYFDESGKSNDHPIVTFCGVCAPIAKINHFRVDWEGLLRYYGIDELHMARASNPSIALSQKIPAQTLEERVNALRPFADCINEKLEIALLQAWDVAGFANLSPVAKKSLGDPKDPYYTAFARAMLELDHYVQSDDYLSLVCDDDAETAWECYQHYRAIRNVDESLKKKTISLAFADSKAFPALQAADMISWLARREARHLFYGDAFPMHDFFEYVTTPQKVGKTQWLKMFADKPAIKKLSDANWSFDNSSAPKSTDSI